jgi:hypothetical protein
MAQHLISTRFSFPSPVHFEAMIMLGEFFGAWVEVSPLFRAGSRVIFEKL